MESLQWSLRVHSPVVPICRPGDAAGALLAVHRRGPARRLAALVVAGARPRRVLVGDSARSAEEEKSLAYEGGARIFCGAEKVMNAMSPFAVACTLLLAFFLDARNLRRFWHGGADGDDEHR